RVLEGTGAANGVPSRIGQLVTRRRPDRRKAGGLAALRQGPCRQRQRARAEPLARRRWQRLSGSAVFRRFPEDAPRQGDPRRGYEGRLAAGQSSGGRKAAQDHPARPFCYFAAFGNAGSFPISRGSCWMITVAFRFFSIPLIRWIEAMVCARSKLKPGTPSLS